MGGAFKTDLRKLEFFDLSKNFVALLEKGDFQGLGSLKYLNEVAKEIQRVTHKAFDGLNTLGSLRVSLPMEFENNFRELLRFQKSSYKLSQVF